MVTFPQVALRIHCGRQVLYASLVPVIFSSTVPKKCPTSKITLALLLLRLVSLSLRTKRLLMYSLSTPAFLL
jgi:hypothetical protein